ncbi:PRD domain-containing protein [Paraliobacillus sp. JSM ZJ581]|uniref:PRD domain-containing protein n=1 Tax=Paraliobacillus sp. JSM ZJ581 TaxID=3342118 RepID=UPI0035A936DF
MEYLDMDQYYQDSGRPELCEKLFIESLNYIKEKGYTIELYQKKALLNHLTEMIKRDNVHKQITIEDKQIFSEIASDSIKIAKRIVDQLKNISDEESYLLAVHFEVVKLN